MQPNDRLKGVHVLVVDDEQDVREIVQFVLEQCGAAVTAAESVPEALDAYNARPPDVLLSDIGMPDHNGFALLARIRKEDAKRGRVTPTIAMTAFTSPADRKSTRTAGFQEYLAKPFHPEDLVAAILRLIDTHDAADSRDRAA